MSTFFHVDMNAFFAAVEVLDNPDLVGKPVIVGGTSNRGVVTSCTYEARAYGVRSAMPSVKAHRLCPHGIFVFGRHHRYSEVSKEIHKIFYDFTPFVESLGIDEAFLDVSSAFRDFDSPVELGKTLRTAIKSRTGITCSVGIAPSKFLAKLASEQAKPKIDGHKVIEGSGVFEVKAGEELEFLHPLPVEAIWGVGKVTLKKVHQLGVNTVADLAAVPVDSLVHMFGESHGRHLHRLANAIDEREIAIDRDNRSVGHERTFHRDLVDDDEIEIEMRKLCASVSNRLVRAEVLGKTITVKAKRPNFEVVNRSKTLDSATDSEDEIWKTARHLILSIDRQDGFRLIGVSASSLTDDSTKQLSLEDVDQTGARVDSARSKVREKFGDSAVVSGTTLVKKDSKSPKNGRK